ncbi:MAG: polysaccharide biosynthesis/export family protein [Candidatus Sericytochromatia bacterium]
MIKKSLLLLVLLLQSCYAQMPERRPPEPDPGLRKLGPREALLGEKTTKNPEAQLADLMQVKLPPDLIQPGDAFNFGVFGEPEFELKGVVVNPEGLLSLPLLGEVAVAGLSLTQAREKIRQALGVYLRNPQPILSAYAFSGRSFTIVGKVNRPGNYSLTSPLRVLDAIGLAGGFSVGIIKNDSTELADLRNAYLVRNQTILPVDFEALVRFGKLAHNIPLLPGDYLYVPSVAMQEVYVLGDVFEQNSFPFREGMSLSQAVAYAKGPRDTANLGQVLLTRGRLSQPELYLLNLNSILKAQEPDVLLQAGDVIYVSAGPLKSFAQVMEVALPTLQAIQGGALLYEIFRSKGTP